MTKKTFIITAKLKTGGTPLQEMDLGLSTCSIYRANTICIANVVTFMSFWLDICQVFLFCANKFF